MVSWPSTSREHAAPVPAFTMLHAVFCVIGLILAVPFLRRLTPPVRRMMLASGGLFLFGALVMEAFGGEVLAAHGGDILARPYRMLVGLEEGAEGLKGSWVCCYGRFGRPCLHSSRLSSQFEWIPVCDLILLRRCRPAALQ